MTSESPVCPFVTDEYPVFADNDVALMHPEMPPWYGRVLWDTGSLIHSTDFELEVLVPDIVPVDRFFLRWRLT